VIDVAVGVLVGVRGCSEGDAFDELAQGVRETGVGIGSLAAALIALVGGRTSATPYQAEALDVWGDILTARAVQPRLTAVRAS
jgi:hypothetical protein